MNPGAISSLLLEGVAQGVFPSAQASIFKDGREVFSAAVGDASPTTCFDLASLTKVMSTTALFMKLWAQGKVGPHTELRRVLPEARVSEAGATFADLLYHRSGLPAFVPFFAPVLRAVPELFAVDCPPATRAAVRTEVIQRAAQEQPIQPIASASIYSDVGFILLGEALATIGGASLDMLFLREIGSVLGLSSTRFHRLSTLGEAAVPNVAPTGITRPREPAPGQDGLWEPFPPTLTRAGEVDDDNAFVLDGVAGHAGLFGTAHDVALFGQAVLDDLGGAGRIAPAALWSMAFTKDPRTPGSTRVMGFDTPTTIGSTLAPTLPQGERAPPAPSSAGRFIGDTPPGAIGHLGFTGTSLWIDRARSLVVALCTNRTHTGRANVRIREFRPRFHDTVVEALGYNAPA